MSESKSGSLRRGWFRAALALMAVVLSTGSTVAVGAAGAPSHPTYPIGSAKSCKANYVKRVRQHRVKGKVVRYVVCVYVAPTKTVPTTTTTVSVQFYYEATTTSDVHSDWNSTYHFVTESARVTGEYPGIGPLGGSVTFTNDYGQLICAASLVGENPVVSCTASALSKPLDPITASYSGYSAPFLTTLIDGTIYSMDFEPSSGTGY